MIRFISLFVIGFCLLANTFGHDYLIGNEYSYYDYIVRATIRFSDQKLNYLYKDRKNNINISLEDIPYRIENEAGIDYLVFNDGNKTIKWLCISSEDILYLYDKENADPFLEMYNTNGSFESLFLMVSGNDFSTSSYLKESTKQGYIEYQAGNLESKETNKPWVEGVDGNGIGESIYLTENIDPNMQYAFFVISNGYVSYNRPDLYKKNGRIKRIRISNQEIGESIDYTVEDTPNLQFFPYQSISKGKTKIEIKILDVYEGTKYEDTCINFIGRYFISKDASVRLKRDF